MNKIAFHGGVYSIELGDNIGSEQSGERPCICISNDINNVKSNIVQVIPLTSKQKNNLPIHYSLSQSKYSFLDNDSTALIEQITTKSVDRIKSFLGRIDDKDMERIKKCIYVQLNL